MNVPLPVAHSACNGLHPVSDSRELGVSALRSGDHSAFHLGRDVCCGSIITDAAGVSRHPLQVV
jgi:hypothetical protein